MTCYTEANLQETSAPCLRAIARGKIPGKFSARAAPEKAIVDAVSSHGCRSGGSIIKHEKLIGRNIQYGRNRKERIQGNSFLDVGRFYMADKCRGAVDPLCKFFLCQTTQLSIICN